MPLGVRGAVVREYLKGGRGRCARVFTRVFPRGGGGAFAKIPGGAVCLPRYIFGNVPRRHRHRCLVNRDDCRRFGMKVRDGLEHRVYGLDADGREQRAKGKRLDTFVHRWSPFFNVM